MTMTNLILPENTPPAAVTSLANQMLGALSTAYPKYAAGWQIQIDTHGGIAQVRNILLSGKYGFQMRLVDIDPEQRKVRYYAGELLERYRLSREKIHGDPVESIMTMDRDFKGEAVHDAG